MHGVYRCSDRSRCNAGDSATEPYIATHNVLRAHAKAVAIYRELKQVGTDTDRHRVGVVQVGTSVGMNQPSLVCVCVEQASPQMQQGQIGITLNCDWAEPMSDSPDDQAAAQR